jgi:hypothetical protein
MTKIIIFDVTFSSVSRHLEAVLSSVAHANVDIKICYLSGPPSFEREGIKFQKVLFLSNLKADILVIFGYRIPDIALLHYFKDCVKTVYVQHGYYRRDMHRTVGGVFQNWQRVLQYSINILELLMSTGQLNYIGYFWSTWVSFKDCDADAENSPDFGYVYSDEWADYHRRFIGWGSTKYRRLSAFEPKKIYKNTTGLKFQYVAQTLVEDGRIKRSVFQDALRELVDNNNTGKIAILLHPRSDRTIYGEVSDKFEYFDDRCFDVLTYGHYSTLLLYLASKKCVVRTLDLPNHPVPDDFLALLNDTKKLPSFTNNPAKSNISILTS